MGSEPIITSYMHTWIRLLYIPGTYASVGKCKRDLPRLADNLWLRAWTDVYHAPTVYSWQDWGRRSDTTACNCQGENTDSIAVPPAEMLWVYGLHGHYWRLIYCEYWRYPPNYLRVPAAPAVSNREIVETRAVPAVQKPEMLRILIVWAVSNPESIRVITAVFSPRINLEPPLLKASECFLQEKCGWKYRNVAHRCSLCTCVRHTPLNTPVFESILEYFSTANWQCILWQMVVSVKNIWPAFFWFCTRRTRYIFTNTNIFIYFGL